MYEVLQWDWRRPGGVDWKLRRTRLKVLQSDWPLWLCILWFLCPASTFHFPFPPHPLYPQSDCPGADRVVGVGATHPLLQQQFPDCYLRWGGCTLTPGMSMGRTLVRLQSNLSYDLLIFNTVMCTINDMYTCADDVLCCSVVTLKRIFKAGARRRQRKTATFQMFQ